MVNTYKLVNPQIKGTMKTKVKSPAYPAIKNYMFGVRVLIIILSIVSFILWLFL